MKGLDGISLQALTTGWQHAMCNWQHQTEADNGSGQLCLSGHPTDRTVVLAVIRNRIVRLIPDAWGRLMQAICCFRLARSDPNRHAGKLDGMAAARKQVQALTEARNQSEKSREEPSSRRSRAKTHGCHLQRPVGKMAGGHNKRKRDALEFQYQ